LHHDVLRFVGDGRTIGLVGITMMGIVDERFANDVRKVAVPGLSQRRIDFVAVPTPGYADGAGPLAIAHRGGAWLAGENTLQAFGRSYALGFRYLEADARLSADGQIVAFHDARLARVTSERARVRSLTLDQLRALSVRGGGSVAGLAELLTALPDARVIVDVKESAVVGPLATLLDACGAAPRVCVAGMRGAWLCRLQDLVGAQLCTALSWRSLLRLASRPSGCYDGAGFAHVPLRLGRVPIFRDDLVSRAHDVGLRLIVWTVNDPETMHRLLDSGVDGIITDRPDVLREVLIARGQWHAPESHGADVTPVVT
jgi:glycerophosphoryl diester phosphodiesterase